MTDRHDCNPESERRSTKGDPWVQVPEQDYEFVYEDPYRIRHQGDSDVLVGSEKSLESLAIGIVSWLRSLAKQTLGTLLRKVG